MRVNISQPFAFNPTGNAAKALEFAAGEQDVPESVAAWLGRNPGYGSVIEDAGAAVPEGGVGEVSEDGARVLGEEEAAGVQFPEGELDGQPEPTPAAKPARRRR